MTTATRRGLADSAAIVQGVGLDAQTRCVHWHSPLDIIAIKTACCGIYHACKDCHEALADHPLEPWPQGSGNETAVRCGACGHEMTVGAYLGCGSICPRCRAAFNPRCSNHHPFYFTP